VFRQYIERLQYRRNSSQTSVAPGFGPAYGNCANNRDHHSFIYICRQNRSFIRESSSPDAASSEPVLRESPAKVAASKGILSPVVAVCWLGLLFASLPGVALPSAVHPPHTLELQVDSPESDVMQAVQAITQDQIIHGTYSYEKERILMGARPAEESKFFGQWNGPGRAFYKVDENVLAPRYFEDTGDIGTITVRYIVQGISATSTDVRIDAVFIDARGRVHWSEGGVESAEYGVILQQVRQMQALRREPPRANESSSRSQTPAVAAQEYNAAPAPGAVTAEQDLEKRVDQLRHQLERRVKADGALLKAAPFQSASTLEKLSPNTEVLLLIVTPYWYGIETDNGHHGWIYHTQLESLP